MPGHCLHPPWPPFARGERICSQSAGIAPTLQGGRRCVPDDRTTRCLGIGLVGPMSNYATPPQLVEQVPYADMDEMRAFARRWRDQHRGKWFTRAQAFGFCVLIKRAVYEAIGGLDERFGLGLFDDDDLAERARRAGFELAVAQDLFVHHFGSRTFVGNGVDSDRLLDENARRFASKWGLTEIGGKRVCAPPVARASVVLCPQPARIRPPCRLAGKRPCTATDIHPARGRETKRDIVPQRAESDLSSEWKLSSRAVRCKSTGACFGRTRHAARLGQPDDDRQKRRR